MSRVTIVMPCYNEAERLNVEEFRRFLSRTPEVRFLFVDDGSTDGTNTVLERICRPPFDRCRYMTLSTNSGKAEAVRQGILAALETSSEYVGFWDADLATPLRTIRPFCRLLDRRPDIAMVMGARVQLLGRVIERKATRHYAGRVFATVVSLMLGIPVYDTQCGAKLFRATDELKSLLSDPFVSKWVFDVEILARLTRARRGTPLGQVEDIVYEFPVREWRDIAGSKLRLSDFVKAVPELARIYWTVLRPSPRGLRLVRRSQGVALTAANYDRKDKRDAIAPASERFDRTGAKS